MTLLQQSRAILSYALISSAAIVLDVFGILESGWIGISIIVFVLMDRTYAILAQTSMERLSVSSRVSGSREARDLTVEYDICNNTIIPIAMVELSLVYPEYLRIIKGSPGAATFIPPKGCVKFTVTFLARVGRHEIGPLRAVMRDLLGLYRGPEMKIGERVVAMVKPAESERLRRALLMTARSIEMARSGRPGDGTEIYDVREYRPGDELKRIYWKALAKGRLVVKEYDREAGRYVLTVIILDKTLREGPYLSTPFEHMARATATISRYLADRNDSQGIIVVGKRILAKRFSKGKRGYINTIDTISNIAASDFVDDLEPSLHALPKEILKLSPRERVNVVVISSIRSAKSVAESIRMLAASGSFSIYLFILMPQFYGLEKVSPIERAAYRIKSFEDIKRSSEIVREIRRLGIRAIRVAPQDTAFRIVSKLESVEVRRA